MTVKELREKFDAYPEDLKVVTRSFMSDEEDEWFTPRVRKVYVDVSHDSPYYERFENDPGPSILVIGIENE